MKTRVGVIIAILILLVSCASRLRVRGWVIDEDGRDLSGCKLFMVSEENRHLLLTRDPKADEVPHHVIAGQFSVAWPIPNEPVVFAIECGEDRVWIVTDTFSLQRLKTRRKIELRHIVVLPLSIMEDRSRFGDAS